MGEPSGWALYTAVNIDEPRLYRDIALALDAAWAQGRAQGRQEAMEETLMAALKIGEYERQEHKE